MTEQELLAAIVANFPDLQGELTIGEFFFEIGLDGSSLEAEIEIAGIMRNKDFKQILRKAGIEFFIDRAGKIHFVEVVTNG